jgi:uncharacterized protein with GYD domain
MAIYIGLHQFTDEGIRNIEQTVERADEFRDMAKSHNVVVKDIYWTHGDYDVITIVDGTDEAVAALYLQLRKKGHVRGSTIRAFSPAEMSSMVLGY